jgi:sodium transport system permease protein
MNLRNILVVYRKELTDSLRDRRTVISMVVIPILMFPLLTIGMGYMVSVMLGKARLEVPQVMIVGGEDSPRLVQQIRELKSIEVVPTKSDYADEISNKVIRAAVEVPPGFDAALAHGTPSQVSVLFYEGEIKSAFASETLQKFLNELRDKTVRESMQARNVPASLLNPFTVTARNVAPPERVAGATFGGMIPYFVIILCLIGAMYPAMDLTAGEKERGTMETILCAPVARTDLVIGKFLMVLTASLTTAILAIASMSISLAYAQKFMSAGADSPGIAMSIGIKGVVAVFAMVLPLSMLFSATLLAISLFAKTYREAQSYVSPLTILVIMPAIAAILPGTELSAKTALIPILNTSLVSKEIVGGIYHWGYIAMIFGSSFVYASVAIAIAIVLFNREDVLFRV